MPTTEYTSRLSRRRLLLLLGGSAAGVGLLTVSGTASAESSPARQQVRVSDVVAAVLAPPALAATFAAAQAGPPLAGYTQATTSGFNSINSTLTFGAPVDVAAGWDGTLWAIDGSGAPHLYDPIADTWQIHSTGVDGAALINDNGPAVYFRG